MRLIVTILFIISSSIFANQITNDADFKSIYVDKKNSNKLVLMIYTAKTCPQCAYMKKKVFKETKVKSFMDKHFVLLQKDINKDDLPKGFEYFGIPTMFFINQQGQQVDKFVGSSRAEPFLKTLEKIAKNNL